MRTIELELKLGVLDCFSGDCGHTDEHDVLQGKPGGVRKLRPVLFHKGARCRAGQGRAGQGRAGQGRAGQ